jgi:hypothetical protein
MQPMARMIQPMISSTVPPVEVFYGVEAVKQPAQGVVVAVEVRVSLGLAGDQRPLGFDQFPQIARPIPHGIGVLCGHQ